MNGWTRKGVTTPHLVLLAPQAVAILRDLNPLTGRSAHVFAGRVPKKPMSENDRIVTRYMDDGDFQRTAFPTLAVALFRGLFRGRTDV
ncbi:hypothetical protein [Zoogloea sp.]|uniref:hypothetical protein n=1 Tax=Zoogloea sp. TaxID=49181 RepID=UPI002622480C|nr:hypothetical protein [Zoogloea sp.]